jgi:hypothetical protein
MKMTMTQALQWVEELNAELKREFEAGYSNLTWQPITVTEGRKWFKLSQGTMVWGFLAKDNDVYKGSAVKAGDLMRPADWRAPARQSRGNVLDNSARYKWTGPHYL